MLTKIAIEGCDDITFVELDLTPEQIETVKTLRDAANKVRTNGCMPLIRMEGDEHFWWNPREEK